jgi:hypothetical protein
MLPRVTHCNNVSASSESSISASVITSATKDDGANTLHSNLRNSVLATSKHGSAKRFPAVSLSSRVANEGARKVTHDVISRAARTSQVVLATRWETYSSILKEFSRAAKHRGHLVGEHNGPA